MLVCVQRLVADRQGAGCQLGEYLRADAAPEPVRPGPRSAGRDDRLIDRCQLRRELFGAGAEQLIGAAAQLAPLAAAAFVEFVLDPAVGAHVEAGQVGAVCADGGVRAGRGDEPTLGLAAGAAAAAAQRSGVARVADRPFGPPRRRWAILAAVRTDRSSPWRATDTDGFLPGGERTRPSLPAAAAYRRWQLVTGIADIG